MKKIETKMIGISLAAALLLGSSAYAGTIVGATAGDGYTTPSQQFSFGGWNLENVAVKITDTNYTEIAKTFNTTDGSYDSMTYGDSFESVIFDQPNGTIMGKLHGKDWPVGEPAGIKIINGDTKVKNGKPENCIMTTSFLSEDDTGTGVSGYLDAVQPVPTICSSPFQSHKRFKINMQPATVDEVTLGEFGNPIDIVFNVTPDTKTMRYQVFQKINNYTGMRLDGYKVEVLGADNNPDGNLTLSLGLGENDGDDIWTYNQLAKFSSGLWGPVDTSHDRDEGFFDKINAGFYVSLTTTNRVESGNTLGSNYTALFGKWLPYEWLPTGIFWDDDNDPETEAELVAFWGTTPTQDFANDTPSWHKGQADNWGEPSAQEFLAWSTDPLYSIDEIEDTVNVGVNYIVVIGAGYTQSTFTLRITPKVALDQDKPSYETTLPTYPDIIDGTIVINPSLFIINDNISIGVKDSVDMNDSLIDTITVLVTTDNGDSETITLTETNETSSIFTALVPTNGEDVMQNNAIINVIDGSIVTATYKGNTATTTASGTAVTPPEEDDEHGIVGDTPVDTDGAPAGGGGGGCSYNPMDKSFDMMFLIILFLGLLYPARKLLRK